MQNPSKYKLVIFDFDGTLSDSFHSFRRNMNLAAGKFHFKRVESHEVETFRSLGSREIVARLGLPFWKLPFVARFMRRAMAENPSEIALFDGVGAMLEALSSRRIELAIVTSNSRENVLRILGPGNLALVNHFECSVSAFGKRRRLRRVLKMKGIGRANAVYVGDEVRDAEAASAEGIDFVGVGWGYASADALRPFSVRPVLRSVAEMIDLVNPC